MASRTKRKTGTHSKSGKPKAAQPKDTAAKAVKRKNGIKTRQGRDIQIRIRESTTWHRRKKGSDEVIEETVTSDETYTPDTLPEPIVCKRVSVKLPPYDWVRQGPDVAQMAEQLTVELIESALNYRRDPMPAHLRDFRAAAYQLAGIDERVDAGKPGDAILRVWQSAAIREWHCGTIDGGTGSALAAALQRLAFIVGKLYNLLPEHIERCRDSFNLEVSDWEPIPDGLSIKGTRHLIGGDEVSTFLAWYSAGWLDSLREHQHFGEALEEEISRLPETGGRPIGPDGKGTMDVIEASTAPKFSKWLAPNGNCTRVAWFKEEYEFEGELQPIIVKALIDAIRDGHPLVRTRDLLTLLDGLSENKNLSINHIFDHGNHLAYNTMIVNPQRGWWRISDKEPRRRRRKNP